MAFSFEKLLVYQKAVDFADTICDHTEQFERGYGFLANQLNRAALSISNNIAEGNGRFTKADRRHFFGISRGSVQECVPMLELARRRRRLLTTEDHTSLKERLEEIARMLSGLMNGQDNRKFRVRSGAETSRWTRVRLPSRRISRAPGNAPWRSTSTSYRSTKKLVDFADAVCDRTERFGRGYGFPLTN
jgi:four helix bundle protein